MSEAARRFREGCDRWLAGNREDATLQAELADLWWKMTEEERVAEDRRAAEWAWEYLKAHRTYETRKNNPATKRWVVAAKGLGRKDVNPRIDAFLSEIVTVCEKHGFSLSHEDTHGAFEIELLNVAAVAWLLAAHDATERDRPRDDQNDKIEED